MWLAVHIHIFIHLCMFTCICMRTHTHSHTHTCTHTHKNQRTAYIVDQIVIDPPCRHYFSFVANSILQSTCIWRTCVCARMCLFVCVCMCACACAHVLVVTYYRDKCTRTLMNTYTFTPDTYCIPRLLPKVASPTEMLPSTDRIVTSKYLILMSTCEILPVFVRARAGCMIYACTCVYMFAQVCMYECVCVYMYFAVCMSWVSRYVCTFVWRVHA